MIKVRVIARDAARKPIRFRQDGDPSAIVADLKFDAGKLTQPEGYFVAEDVPISRPGIQEYSALELGLEASYDAVRLYRPPGEVFDPASMASADRKPTTYYHPPGAVDASNWREYATGHVEEPYATDARDFLRVKKYIVNDAGAISGMASGTRQISCGYDFELDMTPGVTPAGEAYDGIQKNIRINHVATVYMGRCGAGCAIGDCAGDETCACKARGTTNPKTGDIVMRKITVDGIDISIEETPAAVVEKAISGKDAQIVALTKRATDAEGALAAQGEAMKKLGADHAIKVADLEKKVPKPEELTAMVSELAAVAADAKAVLPEIDTKGKSAAQIRIEALNGVIVGDQALKVLATKILGGADPAKAGDVLVRAAFDAVVASSGVSGVDDGYEREMADALTGDKGSKSRPGGAPRKLAGRALMIARSRGAVPSAQ